MAAQKASYGRLTHTFNGMPPDLRIVGTVRRVGNSLAFFIPAKEARRADLKEGQKVEVEIHTEVPDPFGLLKDVPYEPFSREDLWRDRI